MTLEDPVLTSGTLQAQKTNLSANSYCPQRHSYGSLSGWDPKLPPLGAPFPGSLFSSGPQEMEKVDSLHSVLYKGSSEEEIGADQVTWETEEG